MIVLLSCSTSLSSRGQTIISSTGRFTDDSVKVAINDLRKANIKLIQLDYEKDINKNLRQIIANSVTFICPSQIQEDINKEIINSLHSYKLFSKCLINNENL